MAAYKVVITDYEYKSLQVEEDILSELNVEFVRAQCRTEEEVIAAAHDADAILNQYAPITKRVIDSLTRCKVISRYGVGVNTIDVEAATAKGIVVANCTDYCLDEVADHAMALMLSMARKVALLAASVKRGVWDYKRGVPIYRLRGRVLGLVGFGRIPQNLARKAAAFGMRVIAFDPYATKEIAAEFAVELVDLPTLCRTADIVSVHAPLTQQTIGLIGREQFVLMKREAFLVNTSRGPVVAEEALIEALRQGLIAGAALDVLEEEPIRPDHPLLSFEQVIVTPHVAWYSEESEQELKRKVARNVVDVLSGYFPAYWANPQVKAALALKRKP
ncbi:2-hydroxyacid dehydrogenase [Gordoniibacillus kamchatkensis]|uniref:2-hydroxyacid dehydrogenase n=1 Tax=Gordoniibacillus kamchatkensis TaxID=1590651 RepID=A0ABR5AFR1_9BACL|nr:C-terminal binding protein [Paenibacillus sp. VKM B-2647]KIL39884.1 2-hydroxyacid dehydrogenase [Paenibacillus sp. VKM B-2647]